MNEQREIMELLDRYVKGTLSAGEITEVENRMREDESFRALADEHILLTRNLQAYGRRNEMKTKLEALHADFQKPVVSLPVRGWKRYKTLSAVAASVAVVSIAATLWITQNLRSQQNSDYQELRRTVDKIQKSQSALEKNLTRKPVVAPQFAATGFLISSQGYVITSQHVISKADSVYIQNEKYGSLKAVVVHSDPLNDVSVLKIVTPVKIQSVPYTLSQTEAELAEGVYTLGFPREEVVFGEGSISSLTGYRANPNAYQVSVPVNPGNSGGPLLNNQGDLIGMITGVQTQTAGATFAIKSAVLKEILADSVLDSLQAPIRLPKTNTIRNSNRIQQVKKLRECVFLVNVYKN
ncbi:MAG: trypsin-like serine protease [Cyclobacteriaceae bacterium]|nr:MAG: trypsin-like serine protease [Cyclobacteriaceae bacterium]